MIDLDEAERLGKAATHGLWEVFSPDDIHYAVVCEFWPLAPVVFPVNEANESKADAELAVYFRNNCQAIVDELRELRHSNFRLEAALAVERGTGRSGHSIPYAE